MVNQSASPGIHRLLGRAGVLVGAALLFLLSSSPASHADEGGLLEDAAHIVAAAEQAVEPVVQTADSAVQQPVVQAVEPTVQQPVVQAVEPAVQQPVVQAVEPAVQQPVEPAVEQNVQQPVEPVVQAVEPVKESTPVPVAPQVLIIGSANDSHNVEVSPQNGARHVNAGAKGRAGEQRHSKTADRTFLEDLAPRAMGGPGILGYSGAGHDQGAGQSWEDVVALTNALMHLYAGYDVPAYINAGLPAGITRARTAWTVPLLLGLLLGFLSLVLARRRLGDPR